MAGNGLLQMKRIHWRSTVLVGAALALAMVAAAVAVHAMLHGLEAPDDGSAALCWLGPSPGRCW